MIEVPIQVKCLSYHSRKTLVKALIQCRLGNACSAWYAGVSTNRKISYKYYKTSVLNDLKNTGYS